jgi:uncharacterized 2Fe-2S/4Fe-4S cluster protein (DUF4445 family)
VAEHTVTFATHGTAVNVPTGTLLVDAARLAGITLSQPCGGQGRCGRCTVQVISGSVRSRSTLRLNREDIASGYTLACQSVIEGSITVAVPPQDKIERRLTTDRTVAEVTVPPGYEISHSQTIRRVFLSLPPPSLDDQTDDWSRLQTALRNQAGITSLQVSLPTMRQLGPILRKGEWQVTAVIDLPTEQPDQPLEGRFVALYPGDHTVGPLWGAAVDIGTTTVTLWLVDLATGIVRAQVSEYNQQITRGEDVVSRIIYASKNGGAEEMRSLVLGTINQLFETACKRVKASPAEVVKTTITGNSTMIHLLLGLPAQSIRLAPFVTAINHLPLLTAAEVGLEIHPEATVDCLPGIASYVGSDITAGVFSSGMDDAEKLTLFMDVGTNGEIVLGSHEWLISCACSAGPAFEGAGVGDGMRATQGAIEEIWISGRDTLTPYEPNFRVIGNVPPTGLCGSGLLALVAELFLTGLIDKGGNFNSALPTPRIRLGEHGWEYVVAWAGETAHGRDIVFSRTDIDNLLRAKAAIYAGFSVLATSVGLSLEMAERVLIGGSFGRYINVEKAIQIGLLPDMPWDRFQFLGNTAVKGAYFALLDREARKRITDIASRMTYLELSADNSFYESFMSALFLPHTDLFRFPSVALAIENER